MFVYGIVGMVVAVFLIGSGVGIYRAYAKAATDGFTLLVARVWHLPVVKVNGEKVLYADYAEDLRAINLKNTYDIAKKGAAASLSPEEKSDQVLWRLVNNILIEQNARKYNLTATPADLSQIRSQILSKFKSPADADQQLAAEYGWNLATYQQKVVVPYVLENKLVEVLQADKTNHETARQQAQMILDKVKKGENFSDLAKKYGEDGTAQSGGDLGWFAKGVMVPQFEAAVFALKKGELSQALVETPFGFHIVRADDRRVTSEKDAKGKMVSKEEVKASHILIKFADLTRVLNKAVHEADLHLYARVHNPFTNVKK
jgi:PPIC-type PPIASE domain/SurA N-terminal domain